MLSFFASYDFHPALAAFPFALIVVASLIEVVNLFAKSDTFSKAATVNLFLAAGAVIIAFFSGYQAEAIHKIEEEGIRQAVELHHNCGRVLMFMTVAAAIFRFSSLRAAYYRRFFLAVYWALLLGSLVLVIFTGYKGAALVFKFGVGVTPGH